MSVKWILLVALFGTATVHFTMIMGGSPISENLAAILLTLLVVLSGFLLIIVRIIRALIKKRYATALIQVFLCMGILELSKYAAGRIGINNEKQARHVLAEVLSSPSMEKLEIDDDAATAYRETREVASKQDFVLLNSAHMKRRYDYLLGTVGLEKIVATVWIEGTGKGRVWIHKG